MRGLWLLSLALTLGCKSAPTPSTEAAPEEVSEQPAPRCADAASFAEPLPAEESAHPESSAVHFELGRSASNQPIEARLLGGDRQKPVVLLMASIHGDEPSGTPLLRGLERHLAGHPELLANRAVVLVPVANPDGLERDSRHNARNIDLNRNFPASNFRAGRFHGQAPLSEPETQALFGLIHSLQPIRVVTIHMHAACLDFDGPAAELAQAMSELCGLPVRRLGGRPGSLGSYLGRDLGTPIVTLELSRADRKLSESELFDRYRQALLEAILWE